MTIAPHAPRTRAGRCEAFSRKEYTETVHPMRNGFEERRRFRFHYGLSPDASSCFEWMGPSPVLISGILLQCAPN